MRILSFSILLWCYVPAQAQFFDDDDDFRYPSCSICPVGEEPLLGDLLLPANTAGVLPFTMTCDQAQAMARSGSFSPATCAILRTRIYDNCVCRGVSSKGTFHVKVSSHWEKLITIWKTAPSTRVPTLCTFRTSTFFSMGSDEQHNFCQQFPLHRL